MSGVAISENWLRYAPDLIAILGIDGELFFLSDSWEEVLGVPNSELLTQSALSIFHADEVEQVNLKFVAIAGGEPGPDQINRCRVSSGEYRWLSWSGRRGPDNRIYLSARDVTNEKAQNQARDVIAAAFEEHAIVVTTDCRGRITAVNDEFCGISECSRDELIGQTHQLVNSGYHPPSFFTELWNTIVAGDIWRGEIQNRSKSGKLYWVDTTIAPHRDVSGKVDSFTAIQHEVTNRKASLSELSRVSTLYKEVSNVGGVGAWEVDIETGSIFWDEKTRAIHEVEDDFVPTLETGINFYAPVARPIIEAAVQRGIELGEPWDLELPFITYRGKNIWVRAVGRCLSEDGVPVRLVGAFQEITLRKEHLEVITKMRDDALTADAAKTNFLSTVSHELRTPLHGILGLTQLLKKTDTSEMQQQYIGDLESSGSTLLALVNDVLDVTRMESGLLELRNKWSDPNKVFQEVVRELSPQASKKDLMLTLSSDWPSENEGLVDSLRLKQIVTNLVGNAIKFTDIGNVTVALSLVDEDQLCFRIEDTGIGIRSADHKKIFNRFIQVDDSTKRDQGGSGLGLSVTRDLVALMGGRIELESEQGVGSVFTVHLPIQARRVDSRDEQKLPANSLDDLDWQVGRGRRALVVDDVLINRVVCAAMLKEMGFEVTDCESGKDALALFNVEKFDIIFMDLHMPGMSGDECTRRMRGSASQNASVPIIILTADVGTAVIATVMAAGANELCHKPYKSEQLAQVASQYLTELSPPIVTRRLVLIDDDPMEHVLIGEIVNTNEFDLISFESLTHFMRAQLSLTDSDVILLDGRMPPISSHDESLVELDGVAERAQIVLLSSDRFVHYGEYTNLIIAGVADKAELLKMGIGYIKDIIGDHRSLALTGDTQVLKS
jgi:PAS domain S-box-containing protein